MYLRIQKIFTIPNEFLPDLLGGQTEFLTEYGLFLSNSNAHMNVTQHLDPVVQSIVSLMSSLRGHFIKWFTTGKPNTLIFFVEK